MSRKDQRTEAARTRKIEVRFDVSRIQDPISIVPDRVDLRPQDTGIEFVLKTIGGAPPATFPTSDLLTWLEGAAADTAEASFDADNTQVKLPLLARNESAEELRFPYHIRAEYKGTVYTSGGYPAVCDPPPGDPGG